MNKNRVIGTLIGNARLQVDGNTNLVEGKVRNAVGSARDSVRR